jgi:hypothetical protein
MLIIKEVTQNVRRNKIYILQITIIGNTEVVPIKYLLNVANKPKF